MQPLFTIHAGEYLVGSHIEQHLRDPNGDKVNVWVPSKDTGIDLLVTDKTNKKTTSLQVKFSKDFLLTYGRPEYRDKLLSCGWWTLNREKICKSPADYWVFVLHTHGKKDMQYVILTPQQLLERLDAIYPRDKPQKSYQSYLWVTKDNGAGQQCWETRGLKKAQTDALVLGEGSIAPERDFSGFLNDWGAIFRAWG